MAIRMRRGKEADFDPAKLQSGEIAVCTDTGRVYARAESKAVELTGSEHTHEIKDVTGLQSILDSKAADAHNHDDRYYTEVEIDEKLDGKSNTGHTHTADDITGLSSGGASNVVVDSIAAVTDDTLIYIDPAATPDKIPERFYGNLVTGTGSGISTVVSGAAPSDEYLNTSTGYLYVMNSDKTWDYKMQLSDKGIVVAVSDTMPTDTGVKMWLKEIPENTDTDETYNFKRLQILSSRLYGKKLLIAGDSYVSDCYTGGIDGNYKFPAWENLLAEKYNCEYDMRGINGRGLIYSTSAKPSIVEEYPSWDSDRDYIGIVGGRNDYNNSYPIGTNTDATDATFKGGLNVLCNGLQNKYLGKKIFFLTPWCLDNSPNTAGFVQKDYADAIEEICALHSIPCFNSFKSAGINMNIAAFRAKYCQASTDVSHLNADGHAFFFPRIEAWILNL